MPDPARSPVRRRALAIQAAVVVALAGIAYLAAANASDKLARQGIVGGFGFLWRNAGFDISQRLIPYAAATATYGEAILVGLLNTLLVSGLAIVLATALGFALGIARLGPNLLARWLAAGYIDLVRNLPLLLQLLVWYVAVRLALPDPQEPASLWGIASLSQRGLYLPQPDLGGRGWAILVAGVLGLTAAVAARRWPLRLALILGAPVLTLAGLWLAGTPLGLSWPVRGPYDVEGGLAVLPEFAALLIGLSTYTAAFIAEIVRAGLMSVPVGQTDAARAIGLSRSQTLRLVTVPQAMRVIVPPLTSQYLTLTKNSSLAVLIGYPDLVHVVMGTVLNQTNQAIEAVAITMAVYLLVSLSTALAMNAYNARVAPAGRR
ncbi:ABC transporter permease subunit [Methylobacterium sp. Leaf466]|uniref:amino acid ABC transporter permease n=1 Tax=Methylobacterium sp. Leaf466 TaxID=1736386 RepID=UPI0006FCA8B6|nr:ABC transporter permease subunit [Methylobacterium sp. Leaf466]KQT86880.1 amino acid ABC transporter permease [Methylobacterium sp. Leaf466]